MAVSSNTSGDRKMQYATSMKFDKHIITEEYVVDTKTYRAELEIQSLGFCAGMAGYDESSVEVLLYEQGSEVSIGCVGIKFPLLKRSAITKDEQMLFPCLEKVPFGNTPPGRKFTPYAEKEIRTVVTEFLQQKESCLARGFSLHGIRVCVGEQAMMRTV